MCVTFDYGRDDLGRSFSPALVDFYLPRFDEGQKTGNKLFHYAGRFDHLGKEHLPRSKQVANHFHTINERPFNNLDRLARLNASFYSIFFDRVGNPFTRVWAHLSLTLLSRHSRLSALSQTCSQASSATSNSRSVESSRRLKTTSSIRLRRSSDNSLYTANFPTFKMAISSPFSIA